MPDGIYWDGRPFSRKTEVFLIKKGDRGWWVSDDDDYKIQPTLEILLHGSGWEWEDQTHEDQALIVPWELLLEWNEK